MLILFSPYNIFVSRFASAIWMVIVFMVPGGFLNFQLRCSWLFKGVFRLAAKGPKCFAEGQLLPSVAQC